MNARESLAADRIAEAAFRELVEGDDPAAVPALALLAIAAELRAARVYANYLEGRQGSRVSGKQVPPLGEVRP